MKSLAGATVAIALVLAGCGGGGDENPTTSPTSTSAGTTGGAGAAQTAGDSTQIWLTAGEQLKPVDRNLDGSGSELEQATEALVDGPTAKEEKGAVERGTEIPAATDVEGVALADDGTATVKVSRDFLGGIPAKPGERSDEQEQTLDARLSQVTYTLTQFDDVESTKVVAGGISVEPAQDRKDFAKPAGGPPPINKPKGKATPGTQEVQERLVKLHYLPPGAVDGLNGYRTQQAVIAFQSWQGLQRDGVVGPQTSAALASAHRPKPKSSGPSTRIEVYRAKGVALFIKNGKTKRAVHVSAGAPGTETPTGSYKVFRKEKMSWSVPFQTWLPYASYFNAGIAFHEYASVPTYPASHGCVRVPSPEAKFVYGFAAIGTPVFVY